MSLKVDEMQIFVGDLNESVDEQILFNEFNKFGTIMQIKIMRHLVTKKSRGIAYITYTSPTQGSSLVTLASLAKEKMNGASVMGSRVRVMLVGENKNLKKDSIVLLANIDPRVTYEELREACQDFGQVLYLKYNPDVRDPFTNRATVCFETPKMASDCIEGMNGMKLGDKIVSAVLNDRNDKIIVVKGEMLPDMNVVKEALSVVAR